MDGQQRLTSILLSSLGYIPNNDKFASSEKLGTGDDSTEDDDSEDEVAKKSIGWTFRDIIDTNQNENDRDKIIARIEASGKYDKLNDILTDKNINNFLENTFLGFSYIIPNTTDAKIAQQFFSTLFRNMNYFRNETLSVGKSSFPLLFELGLQELFRRKNKRRRRHFM